MSSQVAATQRTDAWPTDISYFPPSGSLHHPHPMYANLNGGLSSQPFSDIPGGFNRSLPRGLGDVSPMSRPVRSTPSSPSGRTPGRNMVPLSPISPIYLGVALTGESKRVNGYGGIIEDGDEDTVVGHKKALRNGSYHTPPSAIVTIGGDYYKAKPTSAKLPGDYQSPVGLSSYPNVLPIPSMPIRSGNTTPQPSSSRIPSRPLVYKSRSRSRPSTKSVYSSGSETETGIESDTTVRPGRIKEHSRSQPDLVALRNNRLEGWVGDVAASQSQMEGKRVKSSGSELGGSLGRGKDERPGIPHQRRASYGKKTTLTRHSPPRSGRTISPRTPNGDLPPLTPLTPRHSPKFKEVARMIPVGGMTSSEDGDDDFDSTDSPSSGSITFSPKRRPLRRRFSPREKSNELMRAPSGLGLVFTDEPTDVAPKVAKPGVQAKEENLFSLRLLAIVPAIWGFVVLLRAAITGGIWVNLYPWGIDTSREHFDRGMMGWGPEGVWGQTLKGDVILAAAWALLTGHYCFDMTTGLTHRWRVYYDLSATITRLLSIQCICWPITGLTLWVLGHERILLAWVVIGCTTAGSRSVQMYVTSNIPTKDVGRDDTTPRRKGALPLPSSRGRSQRKSSEENETDKGSNNEGGKDKSGSGVGQQIHRRWDWDEVAREVGWKLGILMLFTNIWMFWRAEQGSFSTL